ncbi:MAG: NUDIX hydrolase [Bdellovibrionota bacterium]
MSEENPWKTLSTKHIYQNPWIKVREDQVLQPNGAPGIYGVVETKIAVGAVPLTPQHEVYLVGQYRYPTKMYSWEIIEGGAEHGEDPLAAMKRELQEEAGLIAEHWQRLGDDVHLSNCISSEVAMIFLARGFTETHMSPDDTESLTVKRVSLAEALEMIEQGSIKDAMSIIGLTRVERMIREGRL